MPRTVVYDDAVVQAHLADVIEAAAPGTKSSRATRKTARERAAAQPEPTASKAEVAELPPRDSYLSKIAKYVPAETVTVTLAAFAAFDPDGNTIWLFLAAGALANVVYLLGLAMDLPPAQRPRAYFYLLSILAFFGWAVAVIAVVQSKVGIDGTNAEEQQAFVLAATAFLVPALDIILSKLEIGFGS